MVGRLVIVGGAPATGKTTLARALGTSLGLPVITKDDVKEALATPFPTGDRDWSRQLEWREDDAEFVIDIGTPRLVVDTTDGYAPSLEHIVAFARNATVAPR